MGLADISSLLVFICVGGGRQQKSVRVYVVTSFRQMKPPLGDGERALKLPAEKITCYFLWAALSEHSLDSGPSVVINNGAVVCFYEMHLLLISSPSGFREKNVELPPRPRRHKSPAASGLDGRID